MPTLLREGPFRFFFYLGDRGEPPHVHVQRDNNIAKFWLNPVMLERSGGLSRSEIRRVERIIEEQSGFVFRRVECTFQRLRSACRRP